MSSTASNYDVSRLAVGQGIAAFALVFGLATAIPMARDSLTNTIPILVISLLYGVMMFASSYVEEEHHFWFWATTAYLTLLWIKWSVKVFRSAYKTDT